MGNGGQTDFIQAILDRTKKEYITKQYMISECTDHMDFLSQLALRNGKLMKGGEPDVKSVAVVMINDWQRGRIPYFIAPPREEGEEAGLGKEDGDQQEGEEEVEESEEDEEVEDEEDADENKTAEDLEVNNPNPARIVPLERVRAMA